MADAKPKPAMPPATAPKNGETEQNTMAGTSGDSTEAEGVNEVDLDKTRDVVDERLEKLNAANEAGHEKNMKAIEEAHKDNDGDKPKSDPRFGKEDNGCTPRVNADGSKSWFPPGVAGAPVA